MLPHVHLQCDEAIVNANGQIELIDPKDAFDD